MLHTDGSRPLAAAHPGDLPSWSGGPLAWADLAATSRQYARAVPQYLVYMVCAGIIAAFGVLARNSILIVGAMAISPDLWPLCATCIGTVTRRGRLAGRAFAALIIGLAAAGLASYLITLPLRWAGYGPTTGGPAGGRSAGATAALVVLAVNIVMLLTAGTITLLIQRRRRRPT